MHDGARKGAVCAWEEDLSVCGTEFMDGLATCAAGLTGGVVEVDDDDGTDTNRWAVESDCCRDGRLFGACGEAIGSILNVAT